MRADQRRLIFDAAKARGATFTTRAHVALMDAAIDAAVALQPCADPLAPIAARQVDQRAIDLMHSFESCRLDAYPDPGSKDGHPWTIGWGSTGEGIKRGVTWTQAQADQRFAIDVVEFSRKVDALLGDAPTDNSQFGAMVSLAYNIGTEAFRKSTVLRKHKAGDHAGAAAAFNMWVKNDGKVMRGLVRRRVAEAALYLAEG